MARSTCEGRARAATRVASAIACALVAVPAPAQGQQKYSQQPLNMQRDQLGSNGFAATGRARMQSGDWSGALDAFDAALRTSVDPTIHRDRGRCHDRLGDVYPAIDDYRAYLSAVPDAADANAVRDRLIQLEDDASGRGPTAGENPDLPPGMVDPAAASRADAGKPQAAVTTTAGAETADSPDEESDPRASSLRTGRGWGVGPILAEHKWLEDGASFGDAATWAECVGVQVRYAFSAHTAVLVEAAYEHFNTTNLDLALVSGFSSQVAFEWRWALDPRANNQIIVAPGVGYEHLVLTPTDLDSSSVTGDALVPRLRLGYRHLMDRSVGLEVSLDGGTATLVSSSTFPYSYLAAANVALLWGL